MHRHVRCVWKNGLRFLRFLQRMLFAGACISPLVVSAYYVINRLFNSEWDQYLASGSFWVSSLAEVKWITNLLNTINYAALGNVATSIGVTGALFSWLLQIIKDEECGIEMSSLFKHYYPNYVINLWSFIASTAICIYCCDSIQTADNIRPELLLIILFNLIAILVELLYMALMCRKFLFNFHSRKALTHKYLIKEIKGNWNSGQRKGYSTELNNLFGDFSYIVSKTKTHKCISNCNRCTMMNCISDVIAYWVTKTSISSPTSTGCDPVDAEAFQACREIICLLRKNVVVEMTSQLHGCLLVADCCLRNKNTKIHQSIHRTERQIQPLKRQVEIHSSYFASCSWSPPKWLLNLVQKVEVKYTEATREWAEYHQACQQLIERTETIFGILLSLYLIQYIEQNKIKASSDSALNFFDDIALAASFAKEQNAFCDESLRSIMLLYIALLLCLDEGNAFSAGKKLNEIIESNWSSLLKDSNIATDDYFKQARGTFNMTKRIPYFSTTQNKTAEFVFNQILK